MAELTTNTLKVPGASLHTEIRGSGPMLLFIPGGNGDAGSYTGVADALASRYTVVSYDRRGFTRSPLDGPVDDRRLEADVEDAARLIEQLGDGSAHVFGSSSGAIVALELLARYPGQVRVLVAHEPPSVTLLPDGDELLAFLDGVYDTYQRDGFDVAMREFSARVGLSGPGVPSPAAELPPHLAEAMARVRSNMGFWFEHELRQYPRAVPDVEALRAAGARLVLAGGQDSREAFPYRPNTVLAERLGLEMVDFPGDHTGYMQHPAEFATRLDGVLADRSLGVPGAGQG